ncbi:hypothetical protein [Reichenbachiella sp. MALMAid0571]|uniref:hypothetical protein n=1 Tax=Reichenbachiella sp. MALMAid0571 TaxID=3143939 RepID=UPI0032DF3F34
MDNLNNTWLTDNLIDFEYKKYILLAYLQNVENKFKSNELYPQLSDLILHYNNLNNLKNNKELMFEQFPKQLTGLDIQKLKLTYKQIIQDDELMHEISEIINFSMPQMEKTINDGQEIYELVEQHIELDTVGLIPLYNKEGYILLSQDSKKELLIYRYTISLFQHHEEQFRSINTTYISSEIKSISNTLQSIKLGLVKRFKELPNPATYLITSKMCVPVEETLLPVAKRLFMRTVDFT